MAEQHLKTLGTALEQLRERRRNLAANLAGDYQRGMTEQWLEEFVQFQQGIDAIHRAIADEKEITKDPQSSNVHR